MTREQYQNLKERVEMEVIKMANLNAIFQNRDSARDMVETLILEAKDKELPSELLADLIVKGIEGKWWEFEPKV